MQRLVEDTRSQCGNCLCAKRLQRDKTAVCNGCNETEYNLLHALRLQRDSYSAQRLQRVTATVHMAPCSNSMQIESELHIVIYD